MNQRQPDLALPCLDKASCFIPLSLGIVQNATKQDQRTGEGQLLELEKGERTAAGHPY